MVNEIIYKVYKLIYNVNQMKWIYSFLSKLSRISVLPYMVKFQDVGTEGLRFELTF